MKWQTYLWTGGSFLSFALLSLFAPTYASFFALPYLVALSFRLPEIRALVISACIGAVLDISSELLPFGFFAVTLPALTAFLYSLEHFFKKGKNLACALAGFLTLILALIETIWLTLLEASSWMYFVGLPALFGIFSALVALNSLITWSLYRGQEKLDKLYSRS